LNYISSSRHLQLVNMTSNCMKVMAIKRLIRRF